MNNDNVKIPRVFKFNLEEENTYNPYDPYNLYEVLSGECKFGILYKRYFKTENEECNDFNVPLMDYCYKIYGDILLSGFLYSNIDSLNASLRLFGDDYCNSLECLRRYIEKNVTFEANITSNDEFEDGLIFMLAVMQGRTNAVDFLLHGYVDINTEDYAEYTALTYASIFGHKEIVEKLLKYSNLNKNSYGSWKALDIANQTGQTEIANLLKENGITTEWPVKQQPVIQPVIQQTQPNAGFLSRVINAINSLTGGSRSRNRN